jgi:predicted nucleotidyltransferase component of viral defense system
MKEAFDRKYKKVLEILPDVAECAQGKLILAGGTALALFYLKHRVSVDLDLVPVSGDEIGLKEGLKGCLSRMGYRTVSGAFRNQFVVQFEGTGIKIEVFEPEHKIGTIREHVFGGAKIKVASLDDILQMKIAAYGDRREARDLFDIFCMLKANGDSLETVKKLISKNGLPKNVGEIEAMALNPEDVAAFQKVVLDAS